jgi:hypothetical protein
MELSNFEAEGLLSVPNFYSLCIIHWLRRHKLVIHFDDANRDQEFHFNPWRELVRVREKPGKTTLFTNHTLMTNDFQEPQAENKEAPGGVD